MKKQYTISRGGVNWPVAPWVKTLSAASKRDLLRSNAVAGPIRSDHLTKVEYRSLTADEFLAAVDPAAFFAIAAE